MRARYIYPFYAFFSEGDEVISIAIQHEASNIPRISESAAAFMMELD
jgi:hypothetical protein